MIAQRNIMMLWIQIQVMSVLYFTFVYWLVPSEYIISQDPTAARQSNTNIVEKILQALNIAIQYQLGGSDLHNLGWQVSPIGTMQRLLSFGSFAVSSILASQVLADQIRIRNNAQLFGIVDTKRMVLPTFEYTRTVFALHAMMHVLFSVSRSANMWHTDQMSENYGFLSGVFMVVSMMSIALDALTVTTQHEASAVPVQTRQQQAPQANVTAQALNENNNL